MKEIADEVLAELQAGHDFALVRLVAEQGSTPRRAGAEMLVRRDGSIAGTIGGGLLEAAMMGKAGEAIAAGRSEVTSMGLRGTDVEQSRRDDLRRRRPGADRLRRPRRPRAR